MSFKSFWVKLWAPPCPEIKEPANIDKKGHYDMDGVSYDVEDGVVVAGDNQKN